MNRQNDSKRVDSESGIRRDAPSRKGSKPKSPKRAAQRGQRPIGNVAVWYNPPPYHGNDILGGGAGDDYLYGAGGADELYGGDGDDWLMGDSNNLPIAYLGADHSPCANNNLWRKSA
ncbi:hypothetical protein [Propionivibrio sp.]|uniref:hypothetical protein n=1 Tax=Propionivibrio sp. TaxID=2212460 RepID=UPI0025F8501E|nr:hypothetical protein [Propionivibrio sp.]